MTEKTKKWSDEVVNKMLSIVGSESPVSAATVQEVVDALGEDFSTRSVASKLRQLDRDVASLAQVKASAFTEEETDALVYFVEANEGKLTYKEISENFSDGKFTAKQIQGKLLALELTSSVKPAEKVEVARTYSASEEAKFVKMAEDGRPAGWLVIFA